MARISSNSFESLGSSISVESSDWNGKVVLVVNGNSKIGIEYMKLYLRKGARVIALCSNLMQTIVLSTSFDDINEEQKNLLEVYMVNIFSFEAIHDFVDKLER